MMIKNAKITSTIVLDRKGRNNMDIIEFAEKVCGCELMSWQKELLKRVDDLPRDYKLVYCLGRRKWAIVKESELSKTSIVPFPHK